MVRRRVSVSDSGTVDYPARIHKFRIEFSPLYSGTAPLATDQLKYTYLDTTLLYGNKNVLTTGFDLSRPF